MSEKTLKLQNAAVVAFDEIYQHKAFKIVYLGQEMRIDIGDSQYEGSINITENEYEFDEKTNTITKLTV